MNKYFKFWLTIIILIVSLKLCSFIVYYPSSPDKGKIVEIIDGDTYKVLVGHTIIKVRIIGVDVAEKWSVNGIIAINKLKEYMPIGSTVYLEYDIQKTDKYGRTLAHVWYKEEQLRYWLLNNVEAVDMWIKPNYKYKLTQDY